MLRSILVPLDGSDFGEHALPWAFAVTRRTGAWIHLVHAHAGIPFSELEAVTPYQYEGVTVSEYDAKAERAERSYLEDVAERARQRTGLTISWTLVEGDVVEGIERTAQATEAELIVMSTHGRTGLSRAWLGSVAEALLRRTVIPTLVIRPADGTADLGAERSLKHVLVPLDGSPHGERILDPVLELGRAFGARFTLLHVLCTHAVLGGREVPIPSGKLQERAARAEDYLARIADRLRGQGVEVEGEIREATATALAILQAADVADADLIAMATHGHAGLARLLLGSVADKVIRGSCRPVLAQRPGAP